MRTRFLDTDYFSATLTNEALRDFQVLSLPASNICSPDLSLGVEIPFLVPDYSVQHEIDRFTFEEALTDFISYVIPRNLTTGERSSSDGSTGIQFAALYENDQDEIRFSVSTNEDIENADGSFYDEMEAERILEFHSGASNVKVLETLFQFEIAEVDEFSMWKLGVCSNGIDAALFFDIPGVTVPVNNVHVDMGISITSTYDGLLCLIEDVLRLSQESNAAKNKDSGQDKKFYHGTKALTFEVCELGLGLHESLFMDETLSDLLAYLKTQNNDDEFVINANDCLGSTDINVTDLTQDVSEYGPEHKLLSLNFLLEMDPISLNDILEKPRVMHPVISNERSSHFLCETQLEEVQIFDKASVNGPDIFSCFEAAIKVDFLDQMCKEEIGQMPNFYESVLTSELSLMDDTFKLLPTPFLTDEKAIKSELMVVEDILNVLKPHPFSVCDEIYLDWHPLLDGFCNNQTCSDFISMTQKVSSYKIDYSESHNEKIRFSVFDFMNDSSAELTTLHSKEKATTMHENCPDTLISAAYSDVTEIVNRDHKEFDGAKNISKQTPANISSPLELLPQFNDLNFFLGVRKGNTEVSGVRTSSTSRPCSKNNSGDTLNKPSESVSFSQPNKGKIVVHTASLPGYTLDLIAQIQGIFISNFNKRKHLMTNNSLPTMKDYELLSIPMVKLLELISEKGGPHYALGSRDETFIALVTIFVVKQLVYYICFFGLTIAYRFVNICSSKMDNLAITLQPLQSLLQDAHSKVQKQIFESHPSLSLIEGLLRSNASLVHQKTLVISEKEFWPSLKHKLTMLKIPFHEVHRLYCPTKQSDYLDNSISEELSSSDCILLTYENLSASFPFNMFPNILEYGGPRITSTLSDIFICSGVFSRVHFIRLDTKNHHFAKELCEGFDTKKHITEGFPSYMAHLLECLNIDNTEGLLAQFPLDNAFLQGSTGKMETLDGSECAMNKMHLSSSNKATAKAFSVPEVVVIVNTQNIGKKLIISRRSSYQKILALEKGGVQVVERDINLPLDLIFSAAICLVWYEARTIVNKTEVVVDISAVPAFIENIATNILISLCSSFSGCVLIFEGESNFLASIMEASDMLYAAAASLDLNLQLFCSHMPETTDGLILNCIRTSSIIDRSLYSSIPESESIAESFLTKFPSLNPFSAYAIISSGGMLVDFLEWSHERRIQSIGKYNVPAESIYLFSALCKYGELGESKSVMTECSSIDSDNSIAVLQSKRKIHRYGMSSYKPDIPMDESFYVEPIEVNQSSTESSQLNHSSSDLFNPSQLCHTNDFKLHDVPEKAQGFSSAEIMYLKSDVNYLKRNNLGGDKWVNHKHPYVDFHNDVIDYNASLLDEACTSIPGSSVNPKRSKLRCDLDNKSFVSYTFPSSEDINRSENDVTNSIKRNDLQKGFTLQKDFFRIRNNLLHKKHADNLALHNNTNTGSSFSEFLRSNASLPQREGSKKEIFKSLEEVNDWNRVYVPSSSNKRLACPGSSKMKSTYQKRSPSVIDSFRYQGGCKRVKGTDNGRTKLIEARPSPQSLVKKDSPLIKPSWTPMDKRARQDLSFARIGNGQQSRLVWRRSDSPSVGYTLRKRQREKA